MSRRDASDVCPVLLLAAAIIAGSASQGIAQCTLDWRYGPGQVFPGTTGVNGMVAGVPWDPDDIGPESERFLVGGLFSLTGHPGWQFAASWDGTQWMPMTAGLS